MAVQQPRTVGVVADLRVRVPRDAAGDLADGVETVVRRVESVAAVEDVDVTGVTPRLNDLAVEARVAARVALDGGDAAARAAVAERALDDGFGVEVADVTVE